MFKQLKDGWLWAQALDRYERQDFKAAISKLDAIRGPRSYASEYFALLGTAHVALNTPAGKTILLKAIADSKPTRPEYSAYIRAYCNYYLATLDGDEGLAIKSLETALRMDAPPIIRRWLPLS